MGGGPRVWAAACFALLAYLAVLSSARSTLGQELVLNSIEIAPSNVQLRELQAAKQVKDISPIVNILGKPSCDPGETPFCSYICPAGHSRSRGAADSYFLITCDKISSSSTPYTNTGCGCPPSCTPCECTVGNKRRRRCCTSDETCTSDGVCCPKNRYDPVSKTCCPDNRWINGQCCPTNQIYKVRGKKYCCPTPLCNIRQSTSTCQTSKLLKQPCGCADDTGVCCPDGSTCTPDTLNPSKSTCCPASRTYIVNGQSKCCATDTCGNDCCGTGETCATGQGGAPVCCDAANLYTTGDGVVRCCNTGRLCNNVCCDSEVTACDNPDFPVGQEVCGPVSSGCPTDNSQCPGGKQCCPPGKTCIPNDNNGYDCCDDANVYSDGGVLKCCNAPTCGGKCCASGTTCISGECCANSQLYNNGGACCPVALCGTSCCPSGQLCANGACCNAGSYCDGGGKQACCGKGQVCTSDGCCAKSNAYNANGMLKCCADATCGGSCCANGYTCVGSSCCPNANLYNGGKSCCASGCCGGNCCSSGQQCVSGKCCAGTNVCVVGKETKCCGKGEVCTSSGCCPSNRVFSDGSVLKCCSSVTCSGDCCAGKETCVDGACCPAGQSYTDNGSYACCSTQLCGGKCCGAGETCAGGTCCPASQVFNDGSSLQCCGKATCDGECCGADEACIGNECCPAGQDYLEGDTPACCMSSLCNGKCCGTGQGCITVNSELTCCDLASVCPYTSGGQDVQDCCAEGTVCTGNGCCDPIDVYYNDDTQALGCGPPSKACGGLDYCPGADGATNNCCAEGFTCVAENGVNICCPAELVYIDTVQGKSVAQCCNGGKVCAGKCCADITVCPMLPPTNVCGPNVCGKSEEACPSADYPKICCPTGTCTTHLGQPFCCPADNQYGNNCCEEALCTVTNEDGTATAKVCCPADKAGSTCEDGKCCDYCAAAKGCCADGLVCTQDGCCDSDSVNDNGCCADGQVGCGSTCCAAKGEVCTSNNECCPQARVYQDGGVVSCCPPGKVGCGDTCCTETNDVCKPSSCCPNPCPGANPFDCCASDETCLTYDGLGRCACSSRVCDTDMDCCPGTRCKADASCSDGSCGSGSGQKTCKVKCGDKYCPGNLKCYCCVKQIGPYKVPLLGINIPAYYMHVYNCGPIDGYVEVPYGETCPIAATQPNVLLKT